MQTFLWCAMCKPLSLKNELEITSLFRANSITVKSNVFFSKFKVVGISKSFYPKQKKQELLILGKDLSKSKLDFWLEKYLRFRQYPRLIQFPGK